LRQVGRARRVLALYPIGHIAVAAQVPFQPAIGIGHVLPEDMLDQRIAPGDGVGGLGQNQPRGRHGRMLGMDGRNVHIDTVVRVPPAAHAVGERSANTAPSQRRGTRGMILCPAPKPIAQNVYLLVSTT
jgi:hypothetical protein